RPYQFLASGGSGAAGAIQIIVEEFLPLGTKKGVGLAFSKRPQTTHVMDLVTEIGQQKWETISSLVQ
ncbi:hypothetical protein Bpfe_002608, partial [Biomphalaria pfeifferi]